MSRQVIAAVLGAALVLAVVIAAVSSGLGDEGVPDDAVAVVDGDEITREEFDKSLQQAAARQGLPQPPEPGDEQYELIREEALGDQLDIAWILGEAADQGIEVTDTEVQQEFQQTKQENFKTEKEYQQFLQQSGFTQEDVDLRIRLQLISTKIQERVTEDAEEVSPDDAEEFYEANRSQFEQPELRDIRLIQNQDRAAVEQAVSQLQQDNSPQSWKQVAAQFSTDQSSKDNGGLREQISEGIFPDELDEEIFAASEGEVVGPVETPDGFFAFQVDTVTPGQSQSFEDVSPQIQEQLQGQSSQNAFAAFLSDYRDRWTERTVCAEDFLIERCDNATAEARPCPDPTLTEEQQQQQLEQQGCPPPVLSSSPAGPGTIQAFLPSQGQPQRPHPPGEQAAPTGFPGGFPGGIPGAPGAPGGATPPGAPGGATPPGAAPPGG